MKSTVSQSLGSAFLLPTAQAVFQNELVKLLRELAPGINPLTVIAAGANKEAIASLPEESYAGIVQSYSKALRFTFAVGIPFACLALVASLFMPWFKYADTSKKAVPKIEEMEENAMEETKVGKDSVVENRDSEGEKQIEM